MVRLRRTKPRKDSAQQFSYDSVEPVFAGRSIFKKQTAERAQTFYKPSAARPLLHWASDMTLNGNVEELRENFGDG